MKTHTSLRAKRQRGNVLVESAFVSLVFLCLLLGAFDFGQFLFVHQALVERARYAMRWALANGGNTTSDQIKNMVLYYSATDPGNTTGYFGLTSSMVSSTVVYNSTDPVNGEWNNRITINIHDYPYTILSPYIAGTYSGPNINLTIPLGQKYE